MTKLKPHESDSGKEKTEMGTQWTNSTKSQSTGL